jgi:hypothetical protein
VKVRKEKSKKQKATGSEGSQKLRSNGLRIFVILALVLFLLILVASFFKPVEMVTR